MAEDIQDKGQDLLEGAYAPTPEEYLLANEVVKDFHDSAESLREKHDKFSDFLQHYRSIPQIKRPKGMANISIPMAPQHVDTISADLIEKQFSTEGLNIDTAGREGSDKFEADAIRDLIRFQLHQKNGKAVVRDLNFMTLVYGTAPYKVVYDEEYEYVPVRRPIPSPFPDEPPEYEVQRTLVLKYKGPKVIPIDIFDFLPHRNLVDIDKDRLPICHRVYRPLSYLKQKQEEGVYRNVEYIVTDDLGDASVSDDDRPQRARRQDTDVMPGASNVHSGVECIEWEGWREYEGEEQWCIAMIGPGNVVLRFEPLPYYERMYGAQRLFRIPGEFWGIGVVEKNHMIIHAHDAMMNITLDAFYQGVNPQTLVANEAIDDAELVARAGQITHVNTADGEKPLTNFVYRMEPQFVSQDAYILMDRLEKYGEDLSIVTDIKKGNVPAGKQTATAITTSFTQASIRFKDLLFMIEETGVLVICRKMHKINRQFLDTSYVITIIGRNGLYWNQEVTPEQIATDVDFISLASTRELDRTMNIQQMSNLLNISLSSEVLQPTIVPLYMKLAEEMKIPNVDELRDVLQYWANMLQQYQMWKMQAEMQFGYQPPGQQGQLGYGVPPQQLPQATNTADQINSTMQSFRGQVSPQMS